MLRLRPYKPCDAPIIVSWCKDAESFRRWTADRYPAFPITAEDLNRKYLEENGDCIEADNFYPMTACDADGPVGHLILRYTDARRQIVRFGFVIVDDGKRGRGYGKEMLRLALRYAFELLKAEKVTLGVMEDNAAAYYCYRAVGFREAEQAWARTCVIDGRKYSIVEMEIEK